MEFDNLILGKNKTASFNSYETGLNNMTLILGSTGSGKTERLVKPQIMNTFNNNLIVSLAKNGDIKTYKAILEDRGYKVFILDFVNPSESNIGFDPIKNVKTEIEIKNLSMAIAQNDKIAARQDPYWIESCAVMYTALISLLVELHALGKGPEPSLEAFAKLYSKMKPDYENRNSVAMTNLDELFDSVFLYNSSSLAYRSWRTIRGLSVKTSSCLFSTFNNITEAFLTDNIIKISKIKKKIGVDNFLNDKCALFLVTSPVEKSASKFIDIFYTDIFSKLFEVCKNNPLKRPLHMIYDDFACTSKIEDFEQYISIFRSLNVSLSIILQSLTQLEAMYGLGARIIIDNCDRIVFLGSSEMTTCNYVSQRANKPLFEIINMPNKYEVVFERGHKPSIVEKYNTYEDEIYLKYFDNFEI